MRDADDLSFSELRNKRGQNAPAGSPEEPAFTAREFASARPLPPRSTTWEADEPEEKGGFKLPVDQWRLVAAIKRRWFWILSAACVAGVLGFVGGFFKVPYTVNVTLIRPTSSAFKAGLAESYAPEQLTIQTLVNLIKSPGLIRRVAAKAETPVSVKALKESVEVKQEFDSELVTLTIPGKTPQSLLELATNYVNEVLQMGKELQTGGTSNMNTFYKARIKLTKERLVEANDELVRFQKKEFHMFDPETEIQDFGKRLSELRSKYDEAHLHAELVDMEIAGLVSEPARQNPAAQELADAESELRKLRTRMKEAHPLVQAKLKYIAELQQELAELGTNSTPTANSGGNTPVSANDPRLKALLTRKATLEKTMAQLDNQKQELQAQVTGISSNGLMYASLKADVDSLRILLGKMTDRQGQTQLFLDDAQGYYKLVGMDNIDAKARWIGVIKFALIGCFLGALAAGLVIAGFEILDDSLKTTVDVQTVTGLPVLATLGDLNAMSPAEKDTWAFRAWTALSGQLSESANHGMVCGFISSEHGEGRSTWINLLVDAAGQRGLRVLTVTTRPPPRDPETGQPTTKESERQFGEAITQALAETTNELTEQVVTMTPQALVFPAEVTRQLTGPDASPVVHIPLPGWVWNLERRKQWQSALAHWRAIDNLVLLVELPPASVPEAVLLAENLPQLIWLVDSGKPRMRATREQLETLRHAKCRLVGAVLNHEPKPVFQL